MRLRVVSLAVFGVLLVTGLADDAALWAYTQITSAVTDRLQTLLQNALSTFPTSA